MAAGPGSAGTPVADTPAATRFRGGEGIGWARDQVWFTTIGDNRVWHYDVGGTLLAVLYDAGRAVDPLLSGVDTCTLASNGDLLVAEDGGITLCDHWSVRIRLRPASAAQRRVTLCPGGKRCQYTLPVTVPVSGAGSPAPRVSSRPPPSAHR